MINSFVGVWKLDVWEFTDGSTGRTSLPWKGRARGEFRFDANGGAAVQIMREDRPLESAPGGPSWAESLSAEERRRTLDGYLAYWGTYSVDEAAKTLLLHLDGSLRPGWVGGNQERRFEFSADGSEMTLYYIVEQGTHRLIGSARAFPGFLWGGASAPQAELPLGLQLEGSSQCARAEAWRAEQKLRPTSRPGENCEIRLAYESLKTAALERSAPAVDFPRRSTGQSRA